jgi:mannose-6-phosphate isomerase-like protein (cupin superfamily)
MNKSLLLALATAASLAVLAPAVHAQPAPAQAAPAGAAAAADAPREPPSNDQVGVAVDMYVGDASKAPAHVSHDVLFTQSILRAGDPQHPTAPGAVLLYDKEIVLATLPARNETPLTQVPEQLILYVESGQGRLDNGKLFWDLHPGVTILIPPNLAHRLTNSADQPLKFLMLSKTLEPSVTPRKDILVRDVDKLALTERNVHWSNESKYVFQGQQDGMFPSDRVYIVYMGPHTIAGPHAHTPGQEEAWVKVTDGPSYMQLGSEIRPWPANVGFIDPPTGKTVHAAINLSDNIEAWFYFARLQPNPPANSAPRPAPPAIAEALERATIAGRPLPSEAPVRGK